MTEQEARDYVVFLRSHKADAAYYARPEDGPVSYFVVYKQRVTNRLIVVEDVNWAIQL